MLAGRNLETPGEDPYQSGEYAAAWVKGFEHSTDDPTHIQASHYSLLTSLLLSA